MCFAATWRERRMLAAQPAPERLRLPCFYPIATARRETVALCACRGFLADRPAAVAALTRIFIEEIERLLGAAAGVTSDASGPAAARPRLGAFSFLHRFGSALNHQIPLILFAL